MKIFSPFILLFTTLLLSACGESVRNARQEATRPAIFPDYSDVTVPFNIAPLNFCMADESAACIDAVITDAHGNSLHGQGKETTDFDIADWHALLSQNVGDSLQVTVSAKYGDGWRTYQPFNIYVSPDAIDYGLTYRLIEPGYEVYSKMGIYERDLTNFDEVALLENTQFDGCVNCHSFNRCEPKDLSLHIRGNHGATLIRRNGALTAFNTATSRTLGLCVYPYWHPSGRYIAYSTNTTRQVFHVRHNNRIEVYDMASDLQVYDVETNELLLCPLLKQDSVFETFPVFSADGRSLFFCEATAIPQGSINLDSLHYNLCRIDFDPETGLFGNRVDTLVYAEGMGKSVSFPRPSYEGRYLCYTLSDYGQFSIWHHEADLYMLDLQTGESRAMSEANSSDTDSFHNWSSTSRWMVISSRRDDGLFTRPYFCHVDSKGKETKAFLLPQKNPRRFYNERFLSYNVPDFVKAPVKLDSHKAVDIINDERRVNFKVRGVDGETGASVRQH